MVRRRRAQVTRKVNLRKAYEMGGYTGDYAWFVREKVIPVIGESALHSIASQSGSRVREYTVTDRNLHRVVKALGIETTKYEQVCSVKKAIRSAGADATAEVILDLIEKTTQPDATADYPVAFRIPLHPISHNMLYTPKRVGRRNLMYKSKAYIEWRKKFFPLIRSIIDADAALALIDPSKPMEVNFKYGHREKSDRGGVFDRQNFTKAFQDCVFEYLGNDDSKVLSGSMSGEFVEQYSDGYMEITMRNT